MTIHITCPNCSEEFRVRDDAAGKSFKCKVCDTKIRIPADEPEDYGEPDEDDDFAERPRAKQKKKRRSSGGKSTAGPAIGLYVVGGIALALTLARLIIMIVAPPEMPPNATDIEKIAFSSTFYGILTVIPIYYLVIIVGAYGLHTRQLYSIAVLGCLLASIPCCSPCLVGGMPFGIWGLVLLFDEDVKRTFD